MSKCDVVAAQGHVNMVTLDSLPLEILIFIFEKLALRELWSVTTVCKQFKDICRDLVVVDLLERGPNTQNPWWLPQYSHITNKQLQTIGGRFHNINRLHIKDNPNDPIPPDTCSNVNLTTLIQFISVNPNLHAIDITQCDAVSNKANLMQLFECMHKQYTLGERCTLRGIGVTGGNYVFELINKYWPNIESLRIPVWTNEPLSMGAPDWDLAALHTLTLENSPMLVLPESIGNLANLTHCDIINCEFLRVLPWSIGKLAALTHLHIIECMALLSLPNSIGNLIGLVELNLRLCIELTSLPDSIGNLVNLAHLDLTNCESLTSLPDSIGNLVNLTHLLLDSCGSMTSLPGSIGNLKSLTHIDFYRCESLTSLPESIGNLDKLTHLVLSGCGALTWVPESIGNLKSLVFLDLTGCELLTSLPCSIYKLSTHAQIFIRGCALPMSVQKRSINDDIVLVAPPTRVDRHPQRPLPE
jgi:Leucine-rich repeat (LRR) protein